VGHAKHAALAGIEIGIEDAIFVAELQLDAGPFLDLKRRAAEMFDQLPRREAGELRRAPLDRRGLDRLLGRGGLLGPRGAAGKQKDRGEG